MSEPFQNIMQTLFSGSEDAVCAIDSQFNLLWAGSDHAKLYLDILRLHLPASAVSEGVLLLPDGGSLTVADGRENLQCTALPIRADGQPAFLLRFTPKPAALRLGDTDALSLITAMEESDYAAAISVMQSLNSLADPSLESPDMHEMRVTFLRDQCYALLRRSTYCREAVWYEMYEASGSKPFSPQPVSAALRRFLGETEWLAYSVLDIDENVNIEDGLWAAADPSRLTFVLLATAAAALRTHPQLSLLHFSARAENGTIRIEMDFHAQEEGKAPPTRPRPQTEALDRLISGETILERFCKVFGAAHSTLSQNGRVCEVLTLPAAEPPVQDTALHAPHCEYTGSRITLWHILFSEIISSADFPDDEMHPLPEDL